MSLGESLSGSAFLMPALLLCAVTGVRITSRGLAHLRGLERGLAAVTISTFALIVAAVTPAALTILSRTAVLVAAACLALGTWWMTRRPRRPTAVPARAEGPEPPPSSRASTAIAVLAVAAAAVYELARLRVRGGLVPDYIDTVGFHLPGVANWIQTGSLWNAVQFYPGFATAQYPNNGDFLLLAGILPWHDLALARLVMAPFYLLTGVSTYALALRLRSTRAAAATLAAMVMTVPFISVFAFEALPDPLALAMLGIGLTFLVRHLRSGLRSDLLLAGLALGICFGTKWYGLTTVAAVAVICPVAWYAGKRDFRHVAVRSVWLLGLILTGGGFWLVRNLVESGNPIYPKAVRLLGLTLFPGSRHDVIDSYGFSIVHYLGQPHVLKEYVYPGFRDAFELGGLVVLIGVTLALLRLTRHRRATGRAGALWVMLAVSAGIALLYVVTPGSAYGPPGLPLGGAPTLRWLMPVMISAAALTAWAATNLGRGGVLLELAGLAAVLDGVAHGESLSAGSLLEAGLALAVLAACAWIWRRHRHSLFPRLLSPRTGAAVFVASAAVAATVYGLQRTFPRDGYGAYDPVFAYVVEHAPSGHHIGITGEAGIGGLAPVLPMVGPQLGNRIAYVGDISAHSVELPHSRAAFAAEVREGGYDLLEIGRQQTAGTDVVARRLGYRLLAVSPRLELFGRAAR